MIPTAASSHRACPGVPRRYDMKDSKVLAEGYFGVVRSAFDTLERKQVAVKRINSKEDHRGHYVDLLKLIRSAKLLGSHPHIVELVDISLHEPTGNLYVIVGAMDTDLSRILKSRQPLTEEHFQYFTLQLLEALKAMHAIGVVHTNLRPDNIYLTKSCDLRVGGFRSVQLEGTVHDCNDTRREYGQTRWYRSPEIMLQPLSPCAPSMDMFAAGCILAEMYLCQPLLPGTDYIDQIKRICKFTGYDASEDIGISDLVPRTEAFLHRHCVFSKPDLRTIFPRDTSQNGLSLLDALLKLNPSRRITAAQALQHVYFAALEGPYDCSKTTLTRPRADYFAFELDRLGEERLTCAQLQGLIDEELKSYGAEPDCTLHPLYLPLSCR